MNTRVFEAWLLLWPAGSMQSLPAAEHFPHAHSASCSQVPDIVPVPRSVAMPDPQHPEEKWYLSHQCSPLHARISRRSLPHILSPPTHCTWWSCAPGPAYSILARLETFLRCLRLRKGGWHAWAWEGSRTGQEGQELPGGLAEKWRS